MTSASERHAHLHAWAASTILHSVAVTAAVLFVSQLQPLSAPEPFHWEVSLVSPADSIPPDAPIASRLAPHRPQAEVAPPAPAMTSTTPITPQRAMMHDATPSIAPREQPQSAESARPKEQTQALQQLMDALPDEDLVSPTIRQPDTHTPVERSPFDQPTPSVAPEPVAADPASAEFPSVRTHDAAAPPDEPSVTAQPESRQQYEKKTHENMSQVAALPPVQRDEPIQEARLDPPAGPPVEMSNQDTPLPAMPAPPTVSRSSSLKPAVQLASVVGPDYGWLVESIGKRLAELKRYPPTARLNGWQGRVVLRAVIAADGRVADVQVQNSSGYAELDEAAKESLRQASPLDMRHELGRPEIVVKIPVLYALTQ